ncbi:hypothetical protein Celaphus_00013979, partial [Cervus elaphus hippelaphus]
DASATSKPQYVVLIPSQLYAGVPEKVCVLLNHLNETVALTVTLEYQMQPRILFTDLEAKNSFYCRSFTNFIKRKPIYIRKEESLVFVQTDKPIYKPGQTVEPTLGSYKVVLQKEPGQKIKHSFEVNEYVDDKDQPIPNETVVVNVDTLTYNARFTTNEHGLVIISIDTSNFTSSFISV